MCPRESLFSIASKHGLTDIRLMQQRISARSARPRSLATPPPYPLSVPEILVPKSHVRAVLTIDMRTCVLTALGLVSFEDFARSSTRTIQGTTDSSTARLRAAYVLGYRASRHPLTRACAHLPPRRYQPGGAQRCRVAASRPSPPRNHAQ